jgi:hypothetical protein
MQREKEAQYKKEAEALVNEERKAKERPVYAGLEGFQLVEKMGE